VLVVDDDQSTRQLVVRWLEQAELACLQAESGAGALELLRADASRIDAVVLDVMMPGLGGFDVLKVMQEDPVMKLVPVLFLTAHAHDEASLVKSATMGAVDHLSKPFSGAVLRAKVLRAVQQRKDERAMERKLAAAEKLARIDQLTQLGNRQLLYERLREEAAYARRHHRPFCLAILDLDHFKSINDTMGHEGGDCALRHFAKLLNASTRQGDGAFRYGGEEFVLLLRSCEVKAALAATARLRATLKLFPATMPDGSQRHVTFSAGIAVADEANEFLTENLLPRADEALYRAKQAGRDRDDVA
jgi:diguanylate cyclase (GGDEF)-like protein